jgi:Spy/CpxP family protein refolding chaperone
MSRARVMSWLVPVALAVAALPVATQRTLAQEAAGGGPPSRQDAGERMRRQQLEQQLRQNFWRISKQRIGFTDDQMQRLEETTRRFDVRRRALFQDERAQREILRAEILADTRADQGRVSTALDRLLQLQRQRVDLLGEEQRELATFMTPIQRAKFGALQEQVRRRVEALRRERPDSMRPAALGPR